MTKVDQQFTKWMKTSFKFTNLDNLQESFKHLIQLISTILVLLAWFVLLCYEWIDNFRTINYL